MGNKISVVFTEDIIKFVKLLKVQRFSDSQIGYDNYGLYPESHLFDFMAMVLGWQDHRIPGTEDNPLGAEYDEETTQVDFRILEVIPKKARKIQLIFPDETTRNTALEFILKQCPRLKG